VIHHVVGRADLLADARHRGVPVGAVQAIRSERWSAAKIFGALVFAAIAMGSKETGLLVVPAAAAQAWLTRPLKADAVTNGFCAAESTRSPSRYSLCRSCST